MDFPVDWTNTWTIGLSVFLVVCSLFYMSRVILKTRRKVAYKSSKTHAKKDADVVIIGGGVAGCNMGIVLARDGRRVIVIERDTTEAKNMAAESHCVAEQEAMAELGIIDILLSVDDPQHSRGVWQRYLKTDKDLRGKFPKPYITTRHWMYLRAARKALRAEKNATFITGAAATELIEDGDVINGVKYRTLGQDKVTEVRASLTILAGGRHCRFRKEVNMTPPVSELIVVGTVYEGYRLDDVSYSQVMDIPCHLISYNLTSTQSRCLFFVSDSLPDDVSSYLKNDIVAQLPDDCRDAIAKGVEKYGYETMRSHYMPCQLLQKPGVLAIGDAVNVRNAMAAIGQGVALKDIKIWRDLLRDIPNLEDYEKVMTAEKKFYSQRKSHSFVLNASTEVLLTMLISRDDHIKEAWLGFHEYFGLSESIGDDINAIFCGAELRPYVLIKHLYLGLLYSTYLVVTSKPLAQLHRTLLTAVCLYTKLFYLITKFIVKELLL